MNVLRATFLLGALAACGSSVAQPYKCTVGGKPVYQQVPCEGGQQVNTSGAGVADLNAAAPRYYQSELAAIERRRAVEDAVRLKKVFIGMTAEEAVASWGNPDKINRTIGARTTSEQWVYRRGKVGYDQYLYVENGVVRSMQSSE